MIRCTDCGLSGRDVNCLRTLSGRKANWLKLALPANSCCFFIRCTECGTTRDSIETVREVFQDKLPCCTPTEVAQ